MRNNMIAVIPIIAALLNGEVAKSTMATTHVYVIDEEFGTPITNASVKAWFDIDIGWRAWSEPVPIITAETITGESGHCDLSGETNTGEVSVKAWKEGIYYDGWGNSKYSRKEPSDEWKLDNHVITVALQRVEHPIPMFVKRVEKDLFSTNDFFKKADNKLALDLLKGDWLPPVGTGEVADVVFSRKYFKDKEPIEVSYKVMLYPDRYEMTVHFPGEGNGLVPFIPQKAWGIRLRMAPEQGYMPDMMCYLGYNGRIITDRNRNRCYCFRIRTSCNSKGEVVSAYYGKIYGDIGLSEDYLMPEFLYYLNTTPLDRNLEWDTKNNLCPMKVERIP